MIAPVDPYAPESVAVYRLYNHLGALLYVGISQSPKERFQQHARDKQWWPYVQFWMVAWHADRARALAAEAQAIIEEAPAFNAAGTSIASPRHGIGMWREALADVRYRPSLVALDELLKTWMRIASLPPDATSPWTADEAERVYELAKRRAGLWVKFQHKELIRRRVAERDARCVAIQRRDRERERLTGACVEHAPALIATRPS